VGPRQGERDVANRSLGNAFGEKGIQYPRETSAGQVQALQGCCCAMENDPGYL
jgi:hypothetical protein